MHGPERGTGQRIGGDTGRLREKGSMTGSVARHDVTKREDGSADPPRVCRTMHKYLEQADAKNPVG